MPTYAKAIAGFVSTFLAQLAVVLTGPATDFGDLTDGQWVTTVAASIAAGLAVYGIRNGVDADPRTSTPDVDAGHADLSTVLIAAAVAVVVLALWLLLR